MPIPVFIKNIKDNRLLWTVMAFVSSIIGFTCFPMSTTFEDIFGSPKPKKIVIYFVVVFLVLTVTICTMTKVPHWLNLGFTNKWWFKANMSFAVLIIPFFNLFWKKQREEGVKEENVFGRVMDLATTGAFSLTALSLSRELWLGVGVAIFNYFLGILLVLGMELSFKIGLPLATFLCYLLVVIRFYVDDRNNNNNPFQRAPENVLEDEYSNYNNPRLEESIVPRAAGGSSNNNSDVFQVLNSSQNVDGQNNSLIHRRGHGRNNSNDQFQRADEQVNGSNNYINDESESESESEDELIRLYYSGILDRHPWDKTP